MEQERAQGSGFSAMMATAILAALIFTGSAAYRIYSLVQAPKEIVRTATPSEEIKTTEDDTFNTEDLRQIVPGLIATTTSVSSVVSDQIINSYTILKQQNIYTPDIANMVGVAIADSIVTDIAKKTYSSSTILTSGDTSLKAGAAYQSELNRAFSVLNSNTEVELAIFGRYVETKDPKYLTELRSVAELYRSAASAASKVRAPTDVVSYHINILNSLEEFAAVLTALANRADDPFASTALLRNYNEAEQKILQALNALNAYYAARQK